MVPRLSSMGRQAAEQALASLSSAASSSFAADEGLGGLVHQKHRRRHGAQRHAGRFDDALLVERQVHAGADHRDIHLRARNETQIGIARTRRALVEQDRLDDLAFGERGLARPGRHAAPRESCACPPARRSLPWRRRRPAPARCRRPARRCRDCRRWCSVPAPASSRSAWPLRRRRAMPSSGPRSLPARRRGPRRRC